MNKIRNQFFRVPDGDLINETYFIVEKTKNNPFFPDGSYVQATEKALDEFHTAFINAKSGDTMMVAIKNVKKASLDKSLKAQADYVTRTSNGDRVMLMSSGFDLAEARTQRKLSPITSILVETDGTGQATTRVNRVVGARAYIHQYTTSQPTNETRWINKTTTEREHTYTGLEPGVKYWFQVIAVGLKGQEVYSPVIARFIQ